MQKAFTGRTEAMGLLKDFLGFSSSHRGLSFLLQEHCSSCSSQVVIGWSLYSSVNCKNNYIKSSITTNQVLNILHFTFRYAAWYPTNWSSLIPLRIPYLGISPSQRSTDILQCNFYSTKVITISTMCHLPWMVVNDEIT